MRNCSSFLILAVLHNCVGVSKASEFRSIGTISVILPTIINWTLKCFFTVTSRGLPTGGIQIYTSLNKVPTAYICYIAPLLISYIIMGERIIRLSVLRVWWIFHALPLDNVYWLDLWSSFCSTCLMYLVAAVEARAEAPFEGGHTTALLISVVWVTIPVITPTLEEWH